MNPNSNIRVGDRVVVKRTAYGNREIHVGRTGIVKRIQRDYFYNGNDRIEVQMDAPRPEQVVATKVEKVTPTPAATVGDRVKVTKVAPYPNEAGIKGHEGIVAAVESDPVGYGEGLPFAYRVRLTDVPDSPTWTPVVAEVEKLDGPADDPAILLDPARLQAAAFAHQLLGEDAPIADLITLSDYVLGTADTANDGTSPPRAEALAAAKRLTDDDFTDNNSSGNALSVQRDNWADDDVARFEINCEGSAYLTAPRARALAAYLEACALIGESKA